MVKYIRILLVFVLLFFIFVLSLVKNTRFNSIALTEDFLSSNTAINLDAITDQNIVVTTQEFNLIQSNFSYSSNVNTSMLSSLRYDTILQQSDPNTPTIISPPPSEFTSTLYYNSNSVLGIAGSFHVVGFDSVRLNAHTNGNILANTVYANANFGTNNLSDELSYVIHYNQVNSGSASSSSHVLVVGNTNSVELVDNGNAIAVNNTKLDRPKTLWKDDDTFFIDLVSLRSEMQNLSTTLSNYTSFNINENLNPSGGSVDESYITLSDATSGGVFNTTATALSSLKYLGIKGFLSSNNEGVVINVDCEKVAQLYLPISLISVDGQNQSTSEVHSFTNGRVLWNFYNVMPDSGTTIIASLLHGSILAEGTNFTASQNLNGTIIANNININAETHRDDLISKIPTPKTTLSLKINKVWLNSDSSPMDSEGFSAVVQLYKDDVAYGSPVTLDASNGFEYTFNDLDASSVYTLKEQGIFQNSEDVTSSFNLKISQGDNAITLENTKKEETTVVLPPTGGNSLWFTRIGILLMATAIVLLFQFRRKNEIYKKT